MWMLVREGAFDASPSERRKVLAACPDSPGRGDPWRWSVTRLNDHDPWEVEVSADAEFLGWEHEVLRTPGESELVRAPGEEIVVVALSGSLLAQSNGGPWTRWLEAGDVFVLEGEDLEEITLTVGEASSASVVHLRPRGGEHLRWVP